MHRLIPLIASLKDYTRDKFLKDLVAGSVVGVMLIPQGMAYAMIAGLPPVYGLYAAVVPTILYVLFGSSRHVSVGPVAMDSLILFAGVSVIATVGSEQYLAIVVVVTFLVGLIQFTMGVFRLGFIANFLSKPVILGFTFAAAVVIATKQIKYLLKLNPDVIGFFSEMEYYIFNFTSYHGPTAFFALITVLVLVVGKKWIPKLPTTLIIIFAGTVCSYFLQFETMGIELVGNMPGGLPQFSMPDFEGVPIKSFIPLIFTLALMGFVEIYSIGQRLQAKHKDEYEIDPNKELVGIGLGNIFGSFFRSFPTTAGFSRSAVNESSGAQTGIAALIAVTIVIITLMFLMPVFYYLPEALLGAVIFVAILGLIDFRLAKKLWLHDRYDFFMMLSSFFGTIILGIEWGIGVGILLSLLVLIYKTSTPHMAVLGRVAGTSYFRNLDRFDTAIDDENVTILRFDARLYFANVGSLKSKIDSLVGAKPGTKKMILDAQSISDIDFSGIEGLESIVNGLKERNIQFHMVNIIGPVRDRLFISGLSDKIGLTHIHDSIEDALIDNADKVKLDYQTNVK